MVSRVGGAILFEGRDRLAWDEHGRRALRGHHGAAVFGEPMKAFAPVMRIAVAHRDAIRRGACSARILPYIRRQVACRLRAHLLVQAAQ